MTTLLLPRQNLKYLDENVIEVEFNEKELEKKIDFEAVESCFGLWKNKNIDALEYQKKIRSEWK